VCAKRMNVNTSLGHQEALTDALMEVVERWFELEMKSTEAQDD